MYFCTKVKRNTILNKYMNDHRTTFIAFIKLGNFLQDFCNAVNTNNLWSQRLQETIILAGHKNGWFNEENVRFSLKNWGALLTKDKLSEWLSAYDLDENKEKTVALIMAGNIPLVGFHDFLSILITGNHALIRLSSNGNVLIKFIVDYLIAIEPSFKSKIKITDEKLEDFDAVIATGSNNTSRYFEHYFSKGPHVIRKNRNSVAVLTGEETVEQIKALGEDIFRYYGLGCRSISKIYVPAGYDFDVFFKAIYSYHEIINQNKYSNNYDYNKAVYLMSEFKLLDNGFLILKEEKEYSSPIASLFYEYYQSTKELKTRLKQDEHKLQCIVSSGLMNTEVSFGETQYPSLADYADNIDTVEFLLRT